MYNKIMLIGLSDIEGFNRKVINEDGRIELVNPKRNFRVDAKSYLSCLLAASEWGEDLYIDSENDIYDKIEKYIVIGANDGAYIHE